jgi:hypothetical protein
MLARAVVALGAFVSIILVAADGEAFCRGLTVAGPDPVETHTCFDGGSGVYELYWKNLCVGYSLQKDASKQVSLAAATQIAAQAFGAWSAASCGNGSPGIRAVDEGPVNCGAVEYNKDEPNQHVIIFRDDAWPHDDPNNSLALTTITFDATDGEIFDADMEINSHDHTIVADGPASPPAYDLLSILTHEAGHFLGLAHSVDTGAVMYTFYRPGSTTLTADDTAGICSVYAPDGMRSASSGTVAGDTCDPTPRHGFSTECMSASEDGGAGADAGLDDAPRSKSGCSMGPGASSSTEGHVATVLCWLALAAAAFTRRLAHRGAGR